MPKCKKWSFMGCQNRKTRVTFDAIKQKRSSVRCQNAKNGVSWDVIIEKHEVQMMPYSENTSFIGCHNANS